MVTRNESASGRNHDFFLYICSAFMMVRFLCRCLCQFQSSYTVCRCLCKFISKFLCRCLCKSQSSCADVSCAVLITRKLLCTWSVIESGNDLWVCDTNGEPNLLQIYNVVWSYWYNERFSYTWYWSWTWVYLIWFANLDQAGTSQELLACQSFWFYPETLVLMFTMSHCKAEKRDLDFASRILFLGAFDSSQRTWEGTNDVTWCSPLPSPIS